MIVTITNKHDYHNDHDIATHDYTTYNHNIEIHDCIDQHDNSNAENTGHNEPNNDHNSDHDNNNIAN